MERETGFVERQGFLSRRRRWVPVLAAAAIGTAKFAVAGGTAPVSKETAAEERRMAAARRSYLDALHRSGLALMDLGRLEEAEARLAACVAADPANRAYRNSLAMVRNRRRGLELEKRIYGRGWPQVEEVSYRDATLGEALDDLRERSRRMDPLGRGFNLVYRIPPEQRRRRITLELRRIPLDQAVGYACELAGARAVIRGRTVLVSPPSR